MEHPNYGLTISTEEGNASDYFINPLPRAVLRSHHFILLDGEWQFAIDTHDVGLKEKWYTGYHYKNVANWPGSIEEHMSSQKEEGASVRWMDKVVAWYEREFPLPQLTDDEGHPQSIIQLTFGACGYETMVWLNGELLRTIEGEDVHIGEYTSFSYELLPEQLKESNTLTVRIADTMDADIPRGKQESHVYKRGGIWYQTYTGAVRSVWLEKVDRNRLRSRVSVLSVVEDNLVRFNVTTRIHDPGDYVVKLKVFEQQNPEPVAVDSFSLTLDRGEKNQRLILEVPNARFWSPDSPYLYRLVAQLQDSTGHTSDIETFFGLRKIEARGCCIYLNNKPIYLDGILYQPGTATYQQIRKHMIAMKKLGCNLVRIHIAGVDPRIYNLADRLGLLLWVEVPSPHSSTPRSRRLHHDELLRMLALIGTHPSVVIWSLYNEDWGAQDIDSNPETRQYIMDTYHYMKIDKPQFLVVDNDGWKHISYEGKLKSDLLTVHLYTPHLERWRQMLEEIERGKMDGVAAFPLVVGDPFFYRTQVPIVVSEWGGFGFVDYGGPQNDEERTTLIRQFKEELRKRKIAGDVYTQATNIEDEVNGIIDFESGELLVPEGLLKSEGQ